jgi:3D (Asp-Asp-Asp) domain-containing protein
MAMSLRPWVLAAATAAALIASPRSVSARPRRPAALAMTATAYCDRGRTKSGAHARDGVVAADPKRLPLGTRIRIVAPGEPHDGTYVVADTGSAIAGRDLDIFMPSCNRAKAFGRKTVRVRILRRGAGAKDARRQVTPR